MLRISIEECSYIGQSSTRFEFKVTALPYKLDWFVVRTGNQVTNCFNWRWAGMIINQLKWYRLVTQKLKCLSWFTAPIVMIEVHKCHVTTDPWEVDWGSQTNLSPMPSLVLDSSDEDRAVERVESLSVNHEPPRVTRRLDNWLRYGCCVLGVL